MEIQSAGADSTSNVSIHDLPGPDPGQELELLDSVHARYEEESEEGPNQQPEYQDGGTEGGQPEAISQPVDPVGVGGFV